MARNDWKRVSPKWEIGEFILMMGIWFCLFIGAVLIFLVASCLW